MEATVITLPNDWKIQNCGCKLLAKYLNGPASLIFDLYAEGQTELQRSRVSWIDAVVTETMNARMGCERWLRLGTAGVDLSQLDPSWTLDPDVHHKDALVDAYDQVHRALDLSRDRFAQVFKLLAVKRPWLFPMIDNVVAGMFSEHPRARETCIRKSWPSDRNCDARWRLAKSSPEQVAEFLLDEFAFTLGWVEERHPRQLAALAAWLGERLQACLGIGLRLSPIRILDCLIWWDGSGQPNTIDFNLRMTMWKDGTTSNGAKYTSAHVQRFVAELLAANESRA